MKRDYLTALVFAMSAYSVPAIADGGFFNPDGTYNTEYSVDCEIFHKAVWFATLKKDGYRSEEQASSAVPGQAEWNDERKELTLNVIKLVYSTHHVDKSGHQFRQLAKKWCKRTPRPESIADNASVVKFEVSGVRLGMSVQQSVDKLAEHYSISADEFTLHRHPDPMPVTGATNVVDRINYKVDGLSISLELDPDLEREEDGYMVVSEIQILDKRIDTEETLSEANTALGAETHIRKSHSHPEDKDRWAYLWCERTYPDRSRCDFNHAELEIFGTRTILSTGFYSRKFRDDWKKHRNK